MEALAVEFDLLFVTVEDDTASGVCGGVIDGDDIAAGVLARFQSSAREDHQHLCATVAAMAQALKDQGLPLTPVAYFGATASSLDRLSRDPASGSDPAAASLLSFLALALPRVPRSVVRNRWTEVSETLVRILGFDSLPSGCVRSGLRCASYFLVVGDVTDWSALSSLYGVLLCFVTDERPKVRKECHSCLSGVLRSFQNLAVLMPASEDITAIFERFLLLAGGSSADSSPSKCSRGAMQVLYIFNAMKDCLPLMAVKHMNTILKYCKRMLDLRQLIVTRCIMEVLHALCSSPTVEVAPELLQNLFCSLALSVSDNEKSPDQMASTARLLYVGTRKIYDLDKQICIVTLPVIFNALGDILATEHEEAMFAAIEALKGLIRACVDESLIKQGVDQIKTTYGELRKSGPTVIEKICATIEGFLGYRYNAVWDMSFQVLSTTFSQLGESSYYLMAGAVKSLADMQNLSDEDFPFRKQLHECLGSAISAMGPEKFLHILPLNLDVEDVSDANVWLLPILKQHVVGARLSFFLEHILVMVKHIKQKSHKLETEGRIFSARSTEGLVYTLWSLLPAFCNYPIDIKSGFNAIQKELCNALREEPDLRGIICSSLQATIHDFANIADNKVVKKVFMGAMRKLLKVTQEAAKANQPNGSGTMLIDGVSNQASLSHARALLLDLAVSLLPGLGVKEIDFLFGVIKPALQDEEGILQKKAYKILSIILKEHGHNLWNNLDELLELMIASLSSCHFAANRHRLDCLYILIVYMSKDSFDHKRDIISSFLTEIILALKEVNKKTRNKAYDLLVEIGHACEDEERGGRKENLLQFFNLIAGGLAGETPHMISAAVKGLACLAYEFSDLIGPAYNLLPSVFLLLQRKNREIFKAILGLIKVLVVKSNVDGIQMHLKTIVEGLFKRQDDTNNHFKAKVKLLLEMLVRKCGFDAVRAIMPEEHMKLLTNIRKIKERKERKAKSEDGESLASRTSISRHSKWNHSCIFSESGDEDMDDDSDTKLAVAKTTYGRQTKAFARSVRSIRKRQAAKSLPEDFLNQFEDDPLDLLDRQKTRLALRSLTHLKRKQTSTDEPEIGADGRLIVREDSFKPKREKSWSLENDLDTRSHSDNRSVSSSLAMTMKKRRKTTDCGWVYTGSEYTSKRAGGDVKKKDKLEPYAYWRLDRKLLNRRAERKAVARKGLARVMKSSKKLEGKSASSALSLQGLSLNKKHKKEGGSKR
ncbi:NUC173 domain [Musa troglodytarum]|uniref:NUC173 domain n=1 Tax=Musa troglodytarum TaxID=320322 RepID=A0A9E7HJ93_9LILI|nr:NUC173 domain [Musa troglodytarum]